MSCCELTEMLQFVCLYFKINEVGKFFYKLKIKFLFTFVSLKA